MPDIKDLIRQILSDEKLKTSKNFSSKVYEDQPIIKPASQMDSYVPPEIEQMKKLAYSKSTYYSPEQYIFYKQMKYMEKYEDDYSNEVFFSCYYPTYSQMNTSQLRWYFSWRSRVRKGDIRKTSMSYAFVYIYELLHLIGVKNKEQGYAALKNFGDAYGFIDLHVYPYVQRWLFDFVVYYNLDKNYLQDLSAVINDKSLIVLKNFKKYSEEEIFEAICTLSSYKLKNSRFYRNNSEDVKAVVCAVFADLSQYYDKSRKQSFCDRIFGKSITNRYIMFDSAVFYDYKKYKSYKYFIDDENVITCTDGKWYSSNYPAMQGVRGSKKLGDLIKTVDSIMRVEYKFKNNIVQPVDTKYIVDIIKNEIQLLEKRKAEKEAKRIDIDLSKLEGIRTSADIIRDKLITEEETGESEAAEINEFAAAEENTSVSSDISLTEDEREFLRCLLYGKASDFSKKAMISLLADSINEKLYDIFADTVIIFNGDAPEIIEDYENELKGML